MREKSPLTYIVKVIKTDYATFEEEVFEIECMGMADDERAAVASLLIHALQNYTNED